MLVAGVHSASHETPYQGLQGDDIVRGGAERGAERDKERDVAGVDSEVRNVQHLQR